MSGKYLHTICVRLLNKFRDALLSARAVELPYALQKVTRNQLLFAAAAAVVSCSLSLVNKQPSMLLGLVFSFFCVYMNYTTRADYAKGDICEVPAVCVLADIQMNYKPGSLGRNTYLVFQAEGEDGIPQHFEFRMSGRHLFVVGTTYLIYFRKTNPRFLLAFDFLKKV